MKNTEKREALDRGFLGYRNIAKIIMQKLDTFVIQYEDIKISDEFGDICWFLSRDIGNLQTI